MYVSRDTKQQGFSCQAGFTSHLLSFVNFSCIVTMLTRVCDPGWVSVLSELSRANRPKGSPFSVAFCDA
jgi:hypothetical protein